MSRKSKGPPSYLGMDEAGRLKTILEGTRAGTWEWNVQTGETIFNERWAEIIGYRLSELEPVSIETWTRFAHPDDLEHSNQLLEAHFAGITGYYECEARMRHRDGHWVWVRDYGRVVSRTASGAPEWVTGTHIDITASKQHQEALERIRARQADIINSTPSVIYTAEGPEALRITYVSNEVNAVLGYSPEQVIAMSQGWQALIHPGDVDNASLALSKWVGGRYPGTLKTVLRLRDFAGRYRWFSNWLRRSRVSGDFVGSLSDITDSVAMGTRLQKMAAMVPGAIFQFEITAGGVMRFPYVSEGIRTIYGLSPEEVAEDASSVLQAIHPDDRDRVWASLSESHATLEEWHCEYRTKPADDYIWVSGRANAERCENGSVLWHGTITNISSQKALEERLRTLATIDELTGAYRRRHFMKAGSLEFERFLRHQYPFTVVLLDVDWFKQVNDRYGHQRGDEVLIHTTRELRDQLRAVDCLARIGGEEFAVLLPDTRQEEGLVLAERLRLAVSELQFEFDHDSLQCTITCGVAQVGEGDTGFGEVLQRADKALYRGKDRGRNQVVGAT